MALAVRTLPIHLEPVDGEALDSWLEAICRQLGCTWGDFTESVGLAAPAPRHPHTNLADMPHPNRGQTALCGDRHPDPDSALDDPSKPRRHRTGVCSPLRAHSIGPFPWSRFRFSRFCPECLQDNGGRWQLFWRSGWAFACVEHCCLLVDECLACGHRLRGHVGHAELVPDGQRCFHPAARATGRAHRTLRRRPDRCPPLCGWGQGHPTHRRAAPHPEGHRFRRCHIRHLSRPHHGSCRGFGRYSRVWPAGSWPRPVLTIGMSSPAADLDACLRLRAAAACAPPPSVTNPSPGVRLRHTQ